MHVVGCVDDAFVLGGEESPASNVLGSLDDLPRIVAEEQVDHIIVAFSPATGAKLAGLLRSLADQVQISVVPRLFDLLTVRSHVDDLHGLPVVDVAPAALGPADRFAKRGLDIVVSSIGLLLASPAMIAITIGVKLTSPGPILFRQERTGRNGDPFRICKFRTMRVTAESERQALRSNNEVDGPLFKIHDDPRVTRIGKILRKTSLDELPQMLNVLKGDMSLVGPRPFITSESAEIAGWAARRFSVRPGMTGLWQISGRNDLPFEELCRLDYSYVASWSLWWDLRILYHTPASVLRRRGAY
jgi:exopolysaccharide biosynthesis polyprenyl glycosylphosphotransferase